MPDDADATLERLDAIAASLADVATSIRHQREDLRIALEVLVEVAAKVDWLDEVDAEPAPQANGVEVGALMGATQAAWLRLEQRLESEFSDIQRQLRSLTGLTEQTRALPPPPRPPVGSDQLRRAASSLRGAMRGVRRPRR